MMKETSIYIVNSMTPIIGGSCAKAWLTLVIQWKCIINMSKYDWMMGKEVSIRIVKS